MRQTRSSAVMPLAFPSHQGLIAPLWRHFPHRFSPLACGIGAAVPDLVDGIIGLVRGSLGQSYGHSLIGLLLFCIPTGLILTGVTRALARRRLSRSPLSRWAARVDAWSQYPGRASPTLFRDVASVGIGALSHLFFDFISHGNFLWFFPWYEDEEFFPAWWYVSWFEFPLPFYAEPYPIGPHFVSWLLLSVIGAWIFVRRPGSW